MSSPGERRCTGALHGQEMCSGAGWAIVGDSSWAPSAHAHVSVGCTGSPFTGMGMFHKCPHQCPGLDYSCYIVVIIKLIIFLMLQKKK